MTVIFSGCCYLDFLAPNFLGKMDGNVGRLLESLERNDLDKNTVFVFTADQGPQWPFAKWSLYDDGIQVPLMIRWPGWTKPDTRANALVSQVDLLPTFVEIAGGKEPEGIDGRSFMQVSKAIMWQRPPDRKMVEGKAQPDLAIREGHYKLDK